MAYQVVGAKRHALRGSRDKFSTFFRSWYSIDYSISPPLINQRHRLPSGQDKGHDLCDLRDKFSKYLHELIYFATPYHSGKVLQKNWTTHYQKMSYSHDKKKTQYILLFYQLYNLVSHRFSLIYIVDELVMVAFWTHTIAKNGYLHRRPIWLNKPESLRYTIPRSFGQVLGKLLRSPLQPISQTATRLFGCTNRVYYSLSRHLEFLQVSMMALGPICW